MSGVTGSGIVSIWRKLIENYYTVNTADAVMGLSSFLALLFLQVRVVLIMSMISDECVDALRA